MKKVKFELSYDGGNYYGWQRQKDSLSTVQGEVEKALHKLFGNNELSVCASGRTDAGVHAYAQVAHAWLPDKVEDMPLVRGLNSLMPKDISVHSAAVVSDDFHAIASSTEKTYIYKVYNSPTPFALNAQHKLWVRKPLDINKLNELAAPLVGTHDFKSFMTSGSPVPSTVRTIFSAGWWCESNDPRQVYFEVAGNGFLKQMVRNIVGSLLFIHEKDWGLAELLTVLEAKDRRKAFKSAPAHGLYLKKVEYPQEISRSVLDLK